MLRSLTLPVLYRRSRHFPVHAIANRSRLNLAVIMLRSWTQAMRFGPILGRVLWAKRRQVSVTRRCVQNQVRFGLTEPYHYSPAGFAKRVWETANHDRPPLLASNISD